MARSSWNRAKKRIQEREGNRLQALEWNEFEDVSNDERIIEASREANWYPDKTYRNNKFIVQCFENQKILGLDATKLMIRRCDYKPIHNWEDLQRLKNELFGSEAQGLEMYPKESELINSHNFYWIWILKGKE